MSDTKKREELERAVLGGFQRNSAQGVLLSQLIADKVGLASSDLECLSFLEQDGPMTAGRLAELTGLTTGAVTRMIDRLETAKYVRRRDDPSDRRRVVVELVPARVKEFDRFYGPMSRNSKALLARYSDKELALISELLGLMMEFGRKEAARIETLPDAPKRRRVKLKANVLGQKVKVEF